jgi:hypothetical protein
MFACQENVLFRIQGAQIDMFTLSDDLTGLDFDENGVLWALGVDHANTNGFNELYTIDDPLGTPSLSLVSDGLSYPTTSIEWVGNTLYGIQDNYPSGNNHLVTINPLTGVETPVGNTGDTGITPTHVGGITLENGTMWALWSEDPGALYTLDWTLTGGPEPTGTLVTGTDASTWIVTSGLDHDPETGELWGMLKTAGTDISDLYIGIYRIDKVTGDLTLEYDLSSLTAVRGATGFAFVPEPGTLALLAVGGLVVLRRRAR